MIQAESDQEVLERARAGDDRALEELIERFQARVYRFGMKMCGNPEDAKDVLQDTLLTVTRSLREFRGTSSISTWLYTIARSFCIKKRRRSKFAPHREQSLDRDVAPESAEVMDPVRSPDEALADKELHHALDRAIAALEPMYREVLVLRDVEGLSASDVAEVLGISTQAVKSRLHRARRSVRDRLAPLLGSPGDTSALPGTCPDVLDLFSRHLEDEISAQACQTMERHLKACPRCRDACDSLKRTLALCRSTGTAAEVPASVQASLRFAIRNFLAERT